MLLRGHHASACGGGSRVEEVEGKDQAAPLRLGRPSKALPLCAKP